MYIYKNLEKKNKQRKKLEYQEIPDNFLLCLCTWQILTHYMHFNDIYKYKLILYDMKHDRNLEFYTYYI